MNARSRLGLSILGGLSLVAAVVMVVDTAWLGTRKSPKPASQERYRLRPSPKEYEAVMKWLQENRRDLPDLDILEWGPAVRVPDNPITREAATLVQATVRSKKYKDAIDGVEYLQFYLKNDQVLGAVSKRRGDPEVFESSSPDLTPRATSVY